jgi:hypothetical protein
MDGASCGAAKLPPDADEPDGEGVGGGGVATPRACRDAGIADAGVGCHMGVCAGAALGDGVGDTLGAAPGLGVGGAVPSPISFTM